MVTPSLGPTLLQGDWSCQQPPSHCEHRHTDCPEASSLGGLAKMIETDWDSGVKVYLSETNPLHHHYKRGGSGGRHLPKAASWCFPATQHHAHAPAFKEWGCHKVVHITPWLLGPASQASPTVPATISHTQSWLCQYQPSGCNKGLKTPQAPWHSGHIPCQLKLKENRRKSLLSKSHYLRTSMAIEAKRSPF